MTIRTFVNLIGLDLINKTIRANAHTETVNVNGQSDPLVNRKQARNNSNATESIKARCALNAH